MPKKERFFIYGVVLFILLFSFYWFSLGPHMAKQDCIEKADKFSRSGGATFKDTYDSCLLRKGLK